MEKIIPYSGADVFYEVYGEGNPVFLIHGFAEDATIWTKQILYLKDSFRLVVPDIPGSGRTRMTNYAAKVEDHADCIKAILDAENIAACIMVGHSMGGYIALAFAEKYPESLTALGLFHSSTYADSDEKKDARRKSIVFIRQHGAAPFIEQSTPNLFSENSKKLYPEMITELIERYSDFDAAALVSYYEAMIQRPDRTHLLQSFQHPVMFIIGEEDKAVPMQHSLQQCHLPALSFIHISENTAHMGMMEDEIPANRFLKDYLGYVSSTK